MDKFIGYRLSKWNSIKSYTKFNMDKKSELKDRVVKRAKKIKIFYCILFSALSFTTLFTTYNTIRDYLKYDVVSQTRVVSDQPSLFPKITVCSTITFPTKKGSDLIVKIVKKVFDKDFDDSNNISKMYAIDDFLTYFGKANHMAVTEVNFR
jgi:hypothetical protein